MNPVIYLLIGAAAGALCVAAGAYMVVFIAESILRDTVPFQHLLDLQPQETCPKCLAGNPNCEHNI